MEINFLQIFFLLINIILIIVILIGFFKIIKYFKEFILKNKAMNKKLDNILEKINKKSH